MARRIYFATEMCWAAKFTFFCRNCQSSSE